MINKTESLKLLKAWQKEHSAIEKLMTDLETGFGNIHPENKVFETVWKVFDSYTQALAVAVGDKGDWLTWYSAENEMGARGHKAGYDGKSKPIKNLNDLWRLIQESSKR
jgi:hypothetical protein